MKCTRDHALSASVDEEVTEQKPNVKNSGIAKISINAHIILILAVCLIAAGCSYYWFKTVYQPNQRLTLAANLLNNEQKSEADAVLRSFISDYPQHTKVAFAYGKLFELNFSDETKSADILQLLQEKYPASEEYANSLAKSAARKINSFKPLYDYYYNTGYGKDKYFFEAKSLLDELSSLGDSSAFIAAGGHDLIAKLNEIVNPSFGAIEFQLAISSDYINSESVTPADKPKVTLTKSDGTLAKVQYDKETGIVSSYDLTPGNYKLDVNMVRTFGARQGSYLGGELLTIVPGRKYKDTTYLFMKKESSSGFDNIDSRYLVLDNNTKTVIAKQIITPSSDSPVPMKVTANVLPAGYSIPANDYYLFDLDNDMKNELIAYYLKTRSLAVLHWNGEAFEEQTKFQISSNNSHLDFSMYPVSINLFDLEGISFPALGLITTSGESGSYPELTLFHWNGSDGYKIIWDATAGDHGEWQIFKNKIVMSQDNFNPRTKGHTDAKTRFNQEYEYNGTTFILVNAYSSTMSMLNQ